MIIVEDRLQQWLSKQPEYGMGYQKAVVLLSSGRAEHGIIINAQMFCKEHEYPLRVEREDWVSRLHEAYGSDLRIINADLIPRPLETLRGVRRIAIAGIKASTNLEYRALAARMESGPAKDAPITQTSGDQVFKRFSAFANDRRVTAARGLTPGTFATTREDADANVRTGTDAVSRYALENKTPASNVFTISPPLNTDLQRGIVEPAYGEPGGGVEVIFVDGTPENTVTGPARIPDK